MNNFTLPTPEESGYYKSKDVEDALYLILTAIQARTFFIRPKSHWNFYNMQSALDFEIGKFGWSIKNDWIGSKDDGHAIWTIQPK